MTAAANRFTSSCRTAPCSLLAPASPAAVAAGNVKISRVVRRPRLLSNRRNTEPFGLAGGAPCQPGITGINHLIRANGREEDLDAYSQRETMAGNLLIVETPGGGGYDAS